MYFKGTWVIPLLMLLGSVWLLLWDAHTLRYRLAPPPDNRVPAGAHVQE